MSRSQRGFDDCGSSLTVCAIYKVYFQIPDESVTYSMFLEFLGFFSAEILSKFGSGLFLLVQVVMLLDFTNNWNDSWVEKDEQKW